MFTLTIETDNAAFGKDDYATVREIVRILNVTAQSLSQRTALEGFPVRDFNGNTVGRAELT